MNKIELTTYWVGKVRNTVHRRELRSTSLSLPCKFGLRALVKYGTKIFEVPSNYRNDEEVEGNGRGSDDCWGQVHNHC